MAREDWHSPKLARVILALLLPDPAITPTLEHLEEQYTKKRVSQLGVIGAQLWYWRMTVKNIISAKLVSILYRILDCQLESKKN